MSRRIESPEPGFFKMRLARGGPWVPAIIYQPCPIEFHPETFQAVDRVYHLKAEIDGRPVDLSRIWGYGRRIPIAEYLFLRATSAWARDYAPQSPEANPRQPIDFDTLAPPEF
jgi:hypothetical protein